MDVLGSASVGYSMVKASLVAYTKTLSKSLLKKNHRKKGVIREIQKRRRGGITSKYLVIELKTMGGILPCMVEILSLRIYR